MDFVSFVFLFFWILDLVMFVQARDSAHSSESLSFVIFFLLFSAFLRFFSLSFGFDPMYMHLYYPSLPLLDFMLL